MTAPASPAGQRETQRLAHRAAVAEAAREYQTQYATRRRWMKLYERGELFVNWNAVEGLRAALAAPRPWTTLRQRPQPRRLTRRQRRAGTVERRRWERLCDEPYG